MMSLELNQKTVDTEETQQSLKSKLDTTTAKTKLQGFPP